MTLHPEQFEEIKPYLLYDKKLSGNRKNVSVYSSRFNIMARYFAKREFNRANFVEFMGYLTEKGYSNNYINNFIKLAKHVDKFYKINQIQDFTYFDKPKSVIEYLTPQQIEAMIAADIAYDRDNEFKNQRNKALLETMFLTGARINEILSLRWEDLMEGEQPFVIFNQTKVNELRYNPIPQSLYRLLVNLPHFSGFIFSDRSGHQLLPNTVSRDIKARAKAIGIDRRVYNHLIRHSFTKFMLKSGAKIEDVSKLLGHKRIETTYQHYFDVMLEELAGTMQAHHPHFKKEQTLDLLLNKFHSFMVKFVDTDRFHVQSAKHEHHIKLEVHEK